MELYPYKKLSQPCSTTGPELLHLAAMHSAHGAASFDAQRTSLFFHAEAGALDFTCCSHNVALFDAATHKATLGAAFIAQRKPSADLAAPCYTAATSHARRFTAPFRCALLLSTLLPTPLAAGSK
eukprot:3447507-Pleurochrysis_carterae.AAC.1